MSGSGEMPGIAQQKRYIIENARYLSKEGKMMIYRIVMQETPDARLNNLFENQSEVFINLDKVAFRPEVLRNIYSIVFSRVKSLEQPAVTRFDFRGIE